MATRKQILDNNNNEILPITDTDAVRNPQSIGGTLESRLGTFIKGVKKGTEPLTPVDGVVTVPSDIESAQATSVPSTQSATATIDSNHVLQLEIPRGADAVNPFKGWYDSSSNLPVNPVVGDYAYVKGASSTDPAAIYECTTNGTWSDSGRTADTSNVQTFASGEEVNEISIDNDFIGGDDKIAGANEVKILKHKTDDIASVVGGIEFEGKVDIASSGTWVDGKTVYSEGTYEGMITNSSSNSVIAIDVSNYVGKLLYYPRRIIDTQNPTTGLAFYSDSGGNNVITDAGETALSGEEAGTVLSSIIIPQNAVLVRIAFLTASKEDFYAYVYQTMTTDGLVKDVDDLKDDVSDLKNDNNNTKNSIVELQNSKVDAKAGKNLYNSATNTTGKYFANASGLIGDNGNYSITDFIPVTPGDNLYISPKTNEPVAASGAYLIFYKSDKTWLSGEAMGVYQYTVPNNAAYMRFSVANSRTEVQAEIGTSRTTYEQYNPIGGYPIVLPNESVDYNNLTQTLKEKIDNNASVTKFKCFSANGTLEPSEFIRTQAVYLEKDALLSCKIDGIIQNVLVGVGKTNSGYTYSAHWLDIDTTSVKLYWYNNSTNVLLNTYTHGLTFTAKTTIVVETKIEQNTKVTHLKIFDDRGNIFEQSLPNWGVGSAFVTNANTSGNIDCELKLMPCQITKKVWLFGDSYISFVANTKWPYYFAQLGMLNYFSNNQPGLGPDAAYTALTNLLQLGFVPSYLVWLLGMNGSVSETQSGGQYIINPSQKTTIDNVVSLCETYGITLVLGTVPTVPTRQKTGFNNYVKSLGFGVIDFADAVGSDEYGIWHGAPTLNAYTDSEDNTIYVQVYGDGHILASGDHTFDVNGDKLPYDISSVGTGSIVVNSITYNRNSSLDVAGLLSTDGVHPSVSGAKVLASRVFVDFPELSIIE